MHGGNLGHSDSIEPKSCKEFSESSFFSVCSGFTFYDVCYGSSFSAMSKISFTYTRLYQVGLGWDPRKTHITIDGFTFLPHLVEEFPTTGWLFCINMLLIKLKFMVGWLLLTEYAREF